jgi:hypothetical protein
MKLQVVVGMNPVAEVKLQDTQQEQELVAAGMKSVGMNPVAEMKIEDTQQEQELVAVGMKPVGMSPAAEAKMDVVYLAVRMEVPTELEMKAHTPAAAVSPWVVAASAGLSRMELAREGLPPVLPVQTHGRARKEESAGEY